MRGTGTHTETMADGSTAFVGPAVGAFVDDLFQGHWHHVERGGSLALSMGVYPSGQGSMVGTGFYSDAGNPQAVKAKETETNTELSAGSPREGLETRPFNAGVNYCIKF